MRTLYQQHMRKVIITFLLIAAVVFGTVQLFVNEDVSKKYVPEGTAISSVIEAVQKEKNDFVNQVHKIENGFNNLFN